MTRDSAIIVFLIQKGIIHGVNIRIDSEFNHTGLKRLMIASYHANLSTETLLPYGLYNMDKNKMLWIFICMAFH